MRHGFLGIRVPYNPRHHGGTHVRAGLSARSEQRHAPLNPAAPLAPAACARRWDAAWASAHRGRIGIWLPIRCAAADRACAPYVSPHPWPRRAPCARLAQTPPRRSSPRAGARLMWRSLRAGAGGPRHFREVASAFAARGRSAGAGSGVADANVNNADSNRAAVRSGERLQGEPRPVPACTRI